MPTTVLITDMFSCDYASPLGKIILASDGESICGAWFHDQRYACRGLGESIENGSLPVFEKATVWLDAYFSASPMPPLPTLKPQGTAFQKKVWAALLQIPFGSTESYGELALRLCCKSPRAVGSAVGRNPISLFIPCHRVIGAKGALTGYAGGLHRKTRLLELEGAVK